MTLTSRKPVRASQERGARVLPIPPPLYYGAGFAAGILMHRATTTLDIGGRPATGVIGVLVLTGGVSLALTGIAGVMRHRTTIVPHHAVSTLITTGGYRVSRNPMYTGLAIAYVGGALLVGTWWPLAALPAVLLAIRRIVIDPEERYLADRFGDVYTNYRRRTRRWL